MTTTPVINRTMTPLEWGMLVALSILWGGSFFFNGIAVRELPVFTVVVLRVVMAALALWVALWATGTKMPSSTPVWAAFFATGLLNNVVPFTLIVWGQSHIASGVASILNATTPLFTVVVAELFTRDERMTGLRLAGVISGLIGVAVMIGGSAVTTLGLEIAAQLAVVAAAISYACAGVFGRRFKQMGVAPLATAAGQVTASSLLLAPAMLWIDRPWMLPWPSTSAIAALIGVALLSTALAYVLYFRILATAGATNLLLVTFLIPVSAVLLGVTVLDEVLQARHIVGMALIGFGLAMIDGRLLRSRVR